MSSHNDPVKPIPFDVVQSAPSGLTQQDTTTQRPTPSWVLPAFGGLLLLAVAVFFLLPQSIDPTKQGQEPTPQLATSGAQTEPSGTTTVQPSRGATDTTPWSDAQLAKLRKQAQEVLAELLDLQFALQERGVEQWAAGRFAEVATLAAAGDELYKNRQYEKATDLYQQGLTDLQNLRDSIPETSKLLLAQALEAIEQGDIEAADAALEMATLIEPANADIATLKLRTAVLPQLLSLLAQAADAEASGDLATAEQLLQQASKLDPLHQRASGELQRIASKAREQEFNKAMSEGYAALDEGHLDGARKAFRAAAKLQSGSTEATSALQEVEAAATAQQLATLNRSGRQQEQQEQWQKAVAAYEKAQKIDSSVLFASDGLNRSRARAQLDKQLRTVIEQPQRLADAGVAESTAKLVQQAGEVTPRGPVLSQQISRLNTLLAEANTTVDVTLRSDGETEVIVYKVARLGRFQERELTLRPGTYTALGTRNGYRDVRRSFTIAHDSTPPPVTVTCTEPI